MRTKLISAPYTIWMTLFIIVPMGLVAFFAFTDKSGAFTLDNIARVGQYSNVFLRSIWLGALATFTSARLPARVYHRQSGAEPPELPHFAHHAAHVDELPAAHLRMDVPP